MVGKRREAIRYLATQSLLFLHVQSYVRRERFLGCSPLVRCIRKPKSCALRDALDAVLGLIAAALLLRLGGVLALARADGWLLELLRSRVSWLERFPAGFKLHVPLTTNMGYEIRNVLDIHEAMMEAALWDKEFLQSFLIPMFAVLGTISGFGTILALFFDVLRLQMVHVSLLAGCFHVLYRGEWCLLRALWRLFRGKKRNPLRGRTDSMHYDPMQVLLGTVAFCVCIFLWTTLLVYHTCFAVFHAARHVPLAMTWLLYALLRSAPWEQMYLRAKEPKKFPKAIYLREVFDHDTQKLVAIRPVIVPVSFASIWVQHTMPHLKQMMVWFGRLVMQVVWPSPVDKINVDCLLPLGAFMAGLEKNADET